MKVTPKQIKEKVKKIQYHHIPGTTLMMCILTLENGYVVSGQSACADPKEFDYEIGMKFSYEDAENKIWQLEGYLLKEKMYREELGDEYGR